MVVFDHFIFVMITGHITCAALVCQVLQTLPMHFILNVFVICLFRSQKNRLSPPVSQAVAIIDIHSHKFLVQRAIATCNVHPWSFVVLVIWPSRSHLVILHRLPTPISQCLNPSKHLFCRVNNRSSKPI